MTCEICDTATATMWVQAPIYGVIGSLRTPNKPIPSCDDCGPQLGYKILAPLEPVGFVPAWDMWLVRGKVPKGS